MRLDPCWSLSAAPALDWGRGQAYDQLRPLAEEAALALIYDGTAYAVMMGTPGDLDDFAVGFSYSERIIERASDIESIDVVRHERGVELRIWLGQRAGKALASRRRALAGPVGCGLCGIESLEQAWPEVVPVEAAQQIATADIRKAMNALSDAQPLNELTHAVHAAGLWDCRSGRLLALAEDVGRHNALDKVVGRAISSGIAGEGCAVVLTSRVSVELVHKCARLGAGVLIAISAPTALAVRTAQAANVTLIGIARHDSCEVFSHGWRVPGLAGQPTPVLEVAHGQ